MDRVRWAEDERWNEGVAALGGDVYFSAEYHRLHDAGSTRAACSIMREGGSTLLVPGMLVPIDEHAVDLQTPNGYGGPLANEDVTTAWIEDAWAAWRSLARERGIVAAFFRLHPLLENHRCLPGDATIVDDRETVLVDLANGVDAALRAADTRFRNKVKRAERDGLTVRWNDATDWPRFETLYAEAMERLDAAAALRFPSEYFVRLREIPGVELAAVYEGSALLASAVFLGGRVFHYHLGARSDVPENRAMSYLFFAAMRRACERGASSMHLGGGASRAPDDTLLRFKSLMSPKPLRYRVARVIAHPTEYERRVARWETSAGRKSSWLLGYREPLS